MRSSAFLSLVALAADTRAVKLRKTEFNVLVSSRPALILFTADGCKECDRVQAVLDRVSPVLTKTPIASVNCNDEPTVCDDSQVFTVPTLKYTSGNNELVTYKEALDASSVVKYIERQTGSPVADLTEDNRLDFAWSSRVAVIAFLGSDNQPERKIFDAVAERWRAHYSFGNVDGLEKDSKGPSIAVYSQEEDDPVHYRGPFTFPDVEAFLRVATKPRIREYDPIVHEEATKDAKPLAQIFFSNRDDRAELVKSLVPIAKKYKDQLSFMTVLAPDYPKRCEQMHLSKDIKRGFAIANQQGRAYPMSEKVFNANRVAKHVAAYLAGSLTPSIKSEPVPEESTSQSFLTKLVGSNFDDLVFDKSKDVLVEFNVPWCQYCTDLHAVMNELGSKYAKFGLSDKVALASINVDGNDVPIEIDSYPSLRLYRAGTNEIVSFKGNFTEMLTVEQLDAFIAQNGTHGNHQFYSVSTSSKIPVQYSVDLSTNPASWPDPNQPSSGFIDVSKVDVIFINLNAASDFHLLRTGTNESIDYAITQVTKHVARGLYRIVSMNASEYSCVVVFSTEKSRDELMWKNGFPWDKEDDPQPEVVLK
ncbi:hypothetical protein FVER53590_03282 [Fusarium verticillioides]|nr:hypothetical protein FVER53590_03282 [Fusarium verticillioides]